MAPAHIQVFLSQKPSTENRIIRRICKLILSVVRYALESSAEDDDEHDDRATPPAQHEESPRGRDGEYYVRDFTTMGIPARSHAARSDVSRMNLTCSLRGGTLVVQPPAR